MNNPQLEIPYGVGEALAKATSIRDYMNGEKVIQDPRLDQVGAELEWICPVLVFHGWELVYCDI